MLPGDPAGHCGQLLELKAQRDDEEAIQDSPEELEALQCYERALTLQPEDGNALFHRAEALGRIALGRAFKHLQEGDLEAARGELTRARDASPRSREASMAKAILTGL